MPTARTLLCLLAMAALPAAAQEQRIVSPAHRVALVELFTSEGCSSCPPADRWLSALARDPRLWSALVPVAFHVDYWDYIGWPDRFASREFSQRQRQHARHGALSSVYTPGFVVHGREWRGWFRRPVLDLSDPPPAGILELRIAANGQVQAGYSAVQESPEPLELHLAVLGFGLSTEVRAGENEGRTLSHDFVVLGYARTPMSRAGARFAASGALPQARVAAPRRAVAAWVSPPGDPAPLQAAGGWLQD